MRRSGVVGLVASLILSVGCVATRPWVRTEVQRADERTQLQLQMVEDRLDTTERGLSEERVQLREQQSELHQVRMRVEETAKQTDQTRELAAKAETAARDALQTASRITPPKPPGPVAGTRETVVVYFQPAAWLLDNPARLTLEKVVRRLRENPALIVKVEGHADNTGASKLNLKLSQRRADAVWRFLIDNGVKRSRVEAQGVGETQPIASNRSPTGRDQNRRVAITLLPASQ
jgi:OmpA-OmpF porin, OOP family